MEHAAGGKIKARIEKAAAARSSPQHFGETLVVKWLVQALEESIRSSCRRVIPPRSYGRLPICT